MNAIVPQSLGQLSSRFANQPLANNELSAGIEVSFGILGYKGKVWSIRYRGEERVLMREDGDGPRNSVEVILLKGSVHKSKIFYENGYVEGSTEAPDCFSTTGITPDVSAKKKQCNVCTTCPKNAWGSRITSAGKPGKACQDSKRISIVPLGDPANEMFGGPMLLRVPAASLQGLATYAETLGKMGFNYWTVATHISFDPTESYPKFIFRAIRMLNDAEADVVLHCRDGNQVGRILAEGSEATAQIQAPAPTPEQFFMQPPAQQQVQQQVQQPVYQHAPVQPVQQVVQQQVYQHAPVQPVQPVVQQQVQQPITQQVTAPVQPVVEQPEQSSFEDELDKQMENLLG